MKFMLMMNAARGKGDWEVANWRPEDLKAHIDFEVRQVGSAPDVEGGAKG